MSQLNKLTTILECSIYIAKYCGKDTVSAIAFLQSDCNIPITWNRIDKRIHFYYDDIKEKNSIGSCGDEVPEWIVQCTAQYCTLEEKQKIIDVVNSIRDTEIQATIITAQATAIASNSVQINNNMMSELTSIASNLNKNENNISIDVNVESIFTQLYEITNTLENETEKENIINAINEMRETVETPSFAEKYKNFMGIISNHFGVYAPIIATLSQLLQ